MAKKLTISLLSIILVTSLCLSLIGCSTEYGSMPIKLQYGADDSVARMTGDMTATALAGNPDRGFSINAYMRLDDVNIGSYKKTYAFPGPCGHSEHMVDGDLVRTADYLTAELKKYEEYSPHVIVMTVFLSDYVGRELSDNAIEQLYSFIRDFRSTYAKYNLVLKFAYQHIDSDPIPTAENVRSHMKKIGEMISGNVNVIKGVVSAFRMSFVGLDGNFENNPYNQVDTKSIIDGFTLMFPEKYDAYTQAPNVATKNMTATYEKLINMGFYNNHLDGSMNTFISGGTDKKSDHYKQYVFQSESNYNSAAISPNMANIDGKAVLRMMKDGYFTTLDLESIYDRVGNADALIDVWKNTIISKKDLDSMKLPYYDEWFLDKEGASQNRSVFDYLRDFLGYNINITNLSFKKFYKENNDGKKIMHTEISFVITNYGMAAPLHLDNFELYIKNNVTGGYIKGGQGLTYSQYDPKQLVSGGQIKITQLVIGDIDQAVLSGGNTSPEGHSLGIKMYRDKNSSSKNQYVRLSNNVPYSDNINWIYSTKNK